MLDWLFGRKRRDEEFFLKMIKATAEGDQLHRLHQAIATISTEPLSGKDETEQAGVSAAILTNEIVKATISAIDDDDDRYVAGMFAFVFSNYFSYVVAGNFELAAVIAVLRVLGIEEFERSFNTIQEGYSRSAHSKPIEAIGKTCEAWYKNPTPSQLERLTHLFTILRNHVLQR